LIKAFPSALVVRLLFLLVHWKLMLATSPQYAASVKTHVLSVMLRLGKVLAANTLIQLHHRLGGNVLSVDISRKVLLQGKAQ